MTFTTQWISDMQIEIRREWVWTLLAVSLMVVLGGLGYGVSPHAADGRPMLLLPDVRSVETYRRQAVRWVEAWRGLDDHLRSSLTNTSGELLEQSRLAQSDFETAVELARQVDRQDGPPAVFGLRDQAAQTATAYVDATAALNRWLSAPSEENRAALDETYQRASEALTTIQANKWIAGDPATAIEAK